MAAAVQGILLVLLAVSLCRALVGRRRGDIPSKILENGETTTTSTTTASTRRQQGPFDWGLPDWSGPHFEFSWDIPGLMVEGIGEWWSGPNVCVTREEIDEEAPRGGRMHYFQSTIGCDQTQTMYKCVRIVNTQGNRKKITVIHQCCHGYERERGRSGCGKRLELTDPFTTAEKLGSGHFVRALRRIGSSEVGRKNFTLFAPTDEAFREAGLIQHVNPQVVVVSRELGRLAQNLEDTLMSHVVPNLFRTSALYDEQLLDTSVTDNRIRINFYYTPKRVVMANCVPLNSTDNLATTGVIHTVNKVLHPVKESLFDLISRRPEFSTLVQLVRKAGLESKLRHKGQYTLFAPTNTAFGKLDQFVRDKILRGEDCLADVVWNHLLPNVVCSGVIEGRMRSCNVLEKCMNLTGDRSGGITVNNVPLVRRDVMATNGVLHSIDQVFVPDEALGVVHVANKVGATQFTELVKEAGLSKMLQSLSNFTVFLPTNEAVQRLPEEKRNELRRDHQRLGKIIKYHIVPSEQHHYDLHNDLELATLDSTTKKLLIKEYSMFRFPWGRETMATVQCAPIHHTDINACGGVVHIIDKMLVPPAGSVVDLLSRDDRFSRLLQLLRTANLFDELASLGPLTFFAPTNEAFRKVSDSVMTGPLADPEKLKLILKHHMVHDIICCAGVFHRRVARHHTLDGSTVGVARRRNGVYADNVRVTECDLMANGGVVHAVNSLLPRALRMYTDTNTRMSHLFHRPRQFFEHMFSDWGLDFGKK